jgi:hypothetical protein
LLFLKVVLNLPFAIDTLIKRFVSKYDYSLDDLYHSENSFDSKYSKLDIIDQVKYELFSQLAHILLDLNYTINFFFYFFVGSKFRETFFSMFKTKESILKSKFIFSTSNINNTEQTRKISNVRFNNIKNQEPKCLFD